MPGWVHSSTASSRRGLGEPAMRAIDERDGDHRTRPSRYIHGYLKILSRSDRGGEFQHDLGVRVDRANVFHQLLAIGQGEVGIILVARQAGVEVG